MMKKYSKGVTDYAGSDGLEYFAESFVKWRHGDIIEDKELLSIFKGVTGAN